MAKNTAVAACDQVVDAAVQLHGGFGYLRDAEVERHYRDARIMGIGGGTTEIMNEIIAKGMGSMTVLRSALDPPRRRRTRTNRAAMLERLAELDAALDQARGRRRREVRDPPPRPRQAARPGADRAAGRPRTARSWSCRRSPAYGTDFPVGASVVTGIGVVEGVECMIVANDPTVRGGAVNPYTLKKTQRAGEIALANRLPMVNLVESGGADLPTQAEIFIPGGRVVPRPDPALGGAASRRSRVVFGNATAGGAYVPGMSDYTIFVRDRAQGLPRPARRW